MAEVHSYQDEKEVKEVEKKYGDIIHAARPMTEASLRKHPRMPLENRAKIFSPFAALRGYEQKISAEEEKLQRIERLALSAEEIDAISQVLSQLQKGMDVSLSYFHAEGTGADGYAVGSYRELSGKVERIDPVVQSLRVAGTDVRFEDILSIRFPDSFS